MEPMAPITGLHHVRLPIGDLDRSIDWYTRVFDFEVLLYEEEEAGPVGAVLRHRTGIVVGLHLDPARATSLKGFNVLGLATANRDELTVWVHRLDGLGTAHGPITEGHAGSFVGVPDPDGMVVQLHTSEQPDADET
jgi:catechol 2,3-dioxygenase-like lactoylglutathione lyase family enzyme